MNEAVQRTRERGVTASGQACCYVRVTPISMYRRQGNGIHIGLAHVDRDCTYLNPRTDNHCPDSRVIPISGPVLGLLRLCSKCAPKKWRGVTVELPETGQIGSHRGPILLGPAKGAA